VIRDWEWQILARWMKFNLVGAIGIGVQLIALWILTTFGIGYLFATGLAVEAAVLHNFIWHERFTWRDRADGRISGSLGRLCSFNLTTGAVSILGNLVVMRLLVGGTHLRPMIANLISIAVCSLANFIVSDRWVFRAIARAQ
jgi:dolichol-phosphate mannosyltransferase